MAGPDMSRNKDLAGQTVSKGGYNITYNDQGYAVKATNYKHDHFSGTEKSVAAKSADSVTSSSDRKSYGGSSYDQSHFSDAELENAAYFRDLASKGSISWDEAHDYVEKIRNKYGYSGGGYGSEFNPLDLAAWDPDEGGYSGGGGYGGGYGGGGFSYGSAPSYTNRYQSQIDELTAEILGRAPFEYNYEDDPNYQQYKESYTRSGQRAMQDTLGQVSARTGGLASSYATTASQQTYDNYMAELADKIPELRQLAYSMYMDEINGQRADLEMLMALEQGDYAKYQDLLSQYNTDRSFDYGVYRDDIADSRYDQEWDYQVGRDQVADQRYEDETEYSRALERAQTLAAAGDFSGYLDLGYSADEVANLKAAYTRAQAASRISSGGGSSGGSSGSGSSSGSSGDGDIYSKMYQAGVRSEGDAYAWLLASGYNTTQAGKLAGYFADWMENGGTGGEAEENLTVRNQHGFDSEGDLDWIHIPGHGRFSTQEVYNYVESGKVKETINSDGTVSYRWVGD